MSDYSLQSDDQPEKTLQENAENITYNIEYAGSVHGDVGDNNSGKGITTTLLWLTTHALDVHFTFHLRFWVIAIWAIILKKIYMTNCFVFKFFTFLI